MRRRGLWRSLDRSSQVCTHDMLSTRATHHISVSSLLVVSRRYWSFRVVSVVSCVASLLADCFCCASILVGVASVLFFVRRYWSLARRYCFFGFASKNYGVGFCWSSFGGVGPRGGGRTAPLRNTGPAPRPKSRLCQTRPIAGCTELRASGHPSLCLSVLGVLMGAHAFFASKTTAEEEEEGERSER